MLDFLTSHWPEIAGIAALVITLAERIAKLTPTESDNAVLAWIYKIAAVVGIKVEDNPGK